MKNNISSVDLTVLIVFKRELQRIDAMNKKASPNERARSINVIEHLTQRISEIESSGSKVCCLLTII